MNLRKNCIKYSTCYYFSEIIELEYLDIDNDEKTT